MNSWKDTLKELLIGIGLTAALAEIAGVLFVGDKLHYTTGLLIGAAIAAGMAAHMGFSLNSALDWDEKHAKISIYRSYTIRYLSVMIVFCLTVYFGIGNGLSCFLGIMTLKAAAYLQPFVHKFCEKQRQKNEEGGCEDGSINDAQRTDASGDQR